MMLNFCYLKIIRFFSSTFSSKNNRKYSKKCTKKQVRLSKRGYLINNNENEAKNEKADHLDTT